MINETLICIPSYQNYTLIPTEILFIIVVPLVAILTFYGFIGVFKWVDKD